MLLSFYFQFFRSGLNVLRWKQLDAWIIGNLRFNHLANKYTLFLNYRLLRRIYRQDGLFLFAFIQSDLHCLLALQFDFPWAIWVILFVFCFFVLLFQLNWPAQLLQISVDAYQPWISSSAGLDILIHLLLNVRDLIFDSIYFITVWILRHMIILHGNIIWVLVILNSI